MKARHNPIGLERQQFFNPNLGCRYASRQAEASVALAMNIFQDTCTASSTIEAAIGVGCSNEMSGTWVIQYLRIVRGMHICVSHVEGGRESA